MKCYKVISADSVDELVKLVQEHLDSGFTPVGGVSVVLSESKHYYDNSSESYVLKHLEYYQAMIGDV